MALNGRLSQSDLTSENEASKSRFEQDPQLGACGGTAQYALPLYFLANSVVVYHLLKCFRNFSWNVKWQGCFGVPDRKTFWNIVKASQKFPTGISERKISLPFSPTKSPTSILMQITCHLVRVVQLVHANPDGNF